jgi:hypothetical protein
LGKKVGEMTEERKRVLHDYAKDVNMTIEYRFIKAVNEMIERFGSFTTEDHDLFTKYVEYENNRQANNH